MHREGLKSEDDIEVYKRYKQQIHRLLIKMFSNVQIYISIYILICNIIVIVSPLI